MNIVERQKVQHRSIQLVDALEHAEGHSQIHNARMALNEFIGTLIDLVSIYQRPEEGGVGVGPEMRGSRLKRAQQFYDEAHLSRDIERKVTMTRYQLRSAILAMTVDPRDRDNLESEVTFATLHKPMVVSGDEGPETAEVGLYVYDTEYPGESGWCPLPEKPPEGDLVRRPWVQHWESQMVVPTPDLASIEGTDVVIRLSIEALKLGAENSELFFNAEEHGEKLSVSDPNVLAKSFVSALNYECNERGDTFVIQAFDRALSHLVEQGEDGIDAIDIEKEDDGS